MAFPCQTVAREALPAIKAALARALVKEGMTQVEISKILGTTEATISHYMKGERGTAVVLGQHIVDDIGQVAHKIKEGSLTEKQTSQRLCEICLKVRNTCAVCGAETSQDCSHCTHT
jgi:predicted transcriptional regulator